MADFLDTFNRANSTVVGNGWKFKAKVEGDTAHPWQIVNLKTAPNPDTDLTTLIYRDRPVAIGSDYQVVFTFLGASGVNDSECMIRYNATGGQGNRRLSVVCVGTSGSLIERHWNGTSLDQVTLASWTRIADNDYTITVTDVNGTVTVDDTNFTGVAPAASVTTTYSNNATGIGMGSGVFTQFQIIDIDQATSADFDFSPIRTRLRVDLLLDGDDPSTANPSADQYLACIQVSPYVVLDGIPQSVLGSLSATLSADLGTVTHTDTGTLLAPLDVAPGADRRWLPTAASISSGVWSPQEGGVRQFEISPGPTRVASYDYASAYGPVSVEALDFNANGFLQLAGFAGSPAPADYTVLLAGVFKSSRGAKYALLRTDQSDAAGGDPIAVVYSHGRLSLDNGAEMLGYESQKLAGGASLVILSVDNTNQIGTLLVQDHSRTTRQFSLAGFDTSPRFFVGAYMNILDGFNADTAGELDLFELDLWDRALSIQEMLNAVTLLSSVYGVA